MPIYPWKDSNTTREIEVFREFSEYENPPTLEECTTSNNINSAAVMTEEEFNNAKWERIIGRGIKVTYEQGSGKGKWGRM